MDVVPRTGPEADDILLSIGPQPEYTSGAKLLDVVCLENARRTRLPAIIGRASTAATFARCCAWAKTPSSTAD